MAILGTGVGPTQNLIVSNLSTRTFEVDFSKKNTIGSIAALYDNILSLPANIKIKEVHAKIKSPLSGTTAGTETLNIQIKHPALGSSFVNLTASPLFTAAAGAFAAGYNSQVSDQTVFNKGLPRFSGADEKVPIQLLLSAGNLTAGVIEIQVVYEFSFHNFVN